MSEWERCRHWLLPAMVDVTEAEMIALIAESKATLWPGERSALVVQLQVPPPTAHIWIAGGDMDELMAMRVGLETWARGQGCEWISLEGRRGWNRMLSPHGWERHGEELRKRL